MPEPRTPNLEPKPEPAANRGDSGRESRRNERARTLSSSSSTSDTPENDTRPESEPRASSVDLELDAKGSPPGNRNASARASKKIPRADNRHKKRGPGGTFVPVLDPTKSTIIEFADWIGWFQGPSHHKIRILLKAYDALPLDPDELEIFKELTGRSKAFEKPPSTIYDINGRSTEKSHRLGFRGAHKAITHDPEHLAPGEIPTVVFVGYDRVQALIPFRRCEAVFDDPKMEGWIVERTKESLELKNGVRIEIATRSARGLRGKHIVFFGGEELGAWPVEDATANPAEEVIIATQPALARCPGAQFHAAATPMWPEGPMHSAFERAHGHDDPETMVTLASTFDLWPDFPRKAYDEAEKINRGKARAEYFVEWRSSSEAVYTAEEIKAITPPGRQEIPPLGFRYVGFTDISSGTGQDSFASAIGHADPDDGKIILDAIRVTKPKFNIEETVDLHADFFKKYGIGKIFGDSYGAGLGGSAYFSRRGIEYETPKGIDPSTPKTKISSSRILGLAMGPIRSKQVELLDRPEILHEFTRLEQNRETFEHRKGEHDDIAVAISGVVYLLSDLGGRRKAKHRRLVWG